MTSAQIKSAILESVADVEAKTGQCPKTVLLGSALDLDAETVQEIKNETGVKVIRHY